MATVVSRGLADEVTSQSAPASQEPAEKEKKPAPQSKEPAAKQGGPGAPIGAAQAGPAVSGEKGAPAPQQPAQPSPAPTSQAPGAPAGPALPEAKGAPTPQQPGAPAPGTPPPTPVAAPPVPAAAGVVSFRLENADLLQFINLVANQLQMSYILDPGVKGTVTISTGGQLRREDLFPILQSVLRINGATAIQSGNFYRIVPLIQATRIPVEVSSGAGGKAIPPDDRLMMQIIPLRFVLAGDMAKLLTPFLSDGGQLVIHEAGNILILLDTSLNVKRLVEIIEQFDSMTFAREHFRLVAIQNNVASGLVPELESIFAAYALSEKTSPIRFIPLDRINSLLVVTPEPTAFEEVEKWIERLDQPAPPSGVQTFVYRVQNSEANYLQRLLSTVHRGGGGGEGGSSGGGVGGATAGAPGAGGAMQQPSAAPPAGPESGQNPVRGLQITTDPVNNSLIIQCTPQQYAEIVKTLKQLDVIPRQVMIEARVYEVTLTGDLSFGVAYYLQQRSSAYKQGTASFSGTTGLLASAGMLIGQSRELLGFLNADENRSRVRVLSAPTVLAVDNSDAKIQVGSSVPTLSSQAVTPGVQVGGSSVFTNTVQNVDTGIILTVTPRITSTGLVSLKVQQEISSAEPPPAGGIQSPSFLKRSITTNAVVGDGQTIALGGLISQTITVSRDRFPLLGDIPGLGALFGSTSYSTTRDELIILITPRIVRTLEETRDATLDLRDSLRTLKQSFKNEKAMK